MHAIPVLIIKSPVPGLLLVNGQAACEVDGSASLPVSNTGDVFLLFTPYGDYLPAAIKLSFSGGDLVMKDYPYQVTIWPDNIAEVELQPRPAGDILPGRVVDQLRSGGAVFSLIKQSGYTLLVEDEETDEQVFKLNMPGATTGSVRELNISGQEVIGALLDEGSGQRLLLFSKNPGEPLRLLADASGDSIRFEDEGTLIRTTRELHDEAGHSEISVHERRLDGSYAVLNHDYVIDGGSAIRATAQSYGKAFTQALALGLEDEARGYVSPSYLDDVDFREIQMFLGAFSTVEEARYCPSMQEEAALALMTYTAQNARVARVYAFESDGGGITRIKRYDPRGIDK